MHSLKDGRSDGGRADSKLCVMRNVNWGFCYKLELLPRNAFKYLAKRPTWAEVA